MNNNPAWPNMWTYQNVFVALMVILWMDIINKEPI